MQTRKVIGLLVPALAVVAGAALYLHNSSSMSALAAARAANAGAKHTGRNALVVGGTSGIGHGIALRLAKADFAVTIVGRNAEAGAAIVAQLKAAGGGPHAFLPCDASLLANVQRTAAQYAATHPALDVLVLSQGMATVQGRTETAEGLDVKLALHFYSRMAFIDALLPIMRGTPSPRVLSVLSGGVHSPYAEYATDPELKTHYTLVNAANAAGFYNDLALDSYSREPANAGVTFIHAAPGFVATHWGTEMPWAIRMLVRGIQYFATSLEDCGEFMSVPLLARRDAGAGGFEIVGATAAPAARTPLHDTARESVWASTRAALTRILPPPPAAAAATVPAAPAPASGAAAAAAAAAGGGSGSSAPELK